MSIRLDVELTWFRDIWGYLHKVPYLLRITLDSVPLVCAYSVLSIRLNVELTVLPHIWGYPHFYLYLLLITEGSVPLVCTYLCVVFVIFLSVSEIFLSVRKHVHVFHLSLYSIHFFTIYRTLVVNRDSRRNQGRQTFVQAVKFGKIQGGGSLFTFTSLKRGRSAFSKK